MPPMMVMDFWLERIEGDQASLLKNQFWLEERRTMQGGGGALFEPRPW